VGRRLRSLSPHSGLSPRGVEAALHLVLHALTHLPPPAPSPSPNAPSPAAAAAAAAAARAGALVAGDLPAALVGAVREGPAGRLLRWPGEYGGGAEAVRRRARDA
jgi:hypothetical protein